jgi:hypothetical protein
LCGIVVGGGLLGSWIFLGGLLDDIGAFLLVRDDGAGKVGGGFGRALRSSISSMGVLLLANGVAIVVECAEQNFMIVDDGCGRYGGRDVRSIVNGPISSNYGDRRFSGTITHADRGDHK